MNKQAVERFLASAVKSAKNKHAVKTAWLLVMGNSPKSQKSAGSVAR